MDRSLGECGIRQRLAMIRDVVETRPTPVRRSTSCPVSLTWVGAPGRPACARADTTHGRAHNGRLAIDGGLRAILVVLRRQSLARSLRQPGGPCTAASVILHDRWYTRPFRNSIDRPAPYSRRDGAPARRPGPCLPRGRSAWPRRRRRARPRPPFPSLGDRTLAFVPRSGRYCAGGKTWRHIRPLARVPPDRRLARQHHECPR